MRVYDDTDPSRRELSLPARRIARKSSGEIAAKIAEEIENLGKLSKVSKPKRGPTKTNKTVATQQAAALINVSERSVRDARSKKKTKKPKNPRRKSTWFLNLEPRPDGLFLYAGCQFVGRSRSDEVGHGVEPFLNFGRVNGLCFSLALFVVGVNEIAFVDDLVSSVY